MSVKQIILCIKKLWISSVLSLKKSLQFIIKKGTFVKISISPLSCSIQNVFVELSFIDILLCVFDTMSVPKIKPEFSLINFMCIDLSSMKMFSALKKLSDILYSVGFENTISMEKPTWIAFSNINDSSSIFSLVYEDISIVISQRGSHLWRFWWISILREC